MANEVVYIASPEGGNGRNVVAYGVVAALASAKKTAIFRPVACKKESLTTELLNVANAAQKIDNVRALCPRCARKDKSTARGDIVAAYSAEVERTCSEFMVVVGSDGSPIFDPEEFQFNANVATDLKAKTFLAICTIRRNGEQVKATVEACTASVKQAGGKVAGIFITGCTDEKAADAKESLKDWTVPVWTIPAVDFPSNSDPDAATKAAKAFSENAPTEQVVKAARTPFTAPTTPYAFQNELLAKAKADKKTIVLPEGSEDRIIKAADYLLQRDIVNLIIVGDRDAILARGKKLGLASLKKASYQTMDDETVLQPMVAKLCELRAKKGVTEGQARQQLQDPSYFGTMLVALGKADGLVSGSVDSTANTVRPALQVIKTKPDASLVSGAFLMCFEDHVAVFADCAINLNPNPEQLADIAIQSAGTARAFGIDPKVGMLCYSTLGSGQGPDVDMVEKATKLVHEKAPDLPVVGSIQFDAAWSPTVAATKAKGNDVAGHVNVFVFPSLAAGNIAYKAVQRTSGAIAIGPVLQGLNKPVNDLSRGALVEDIINTVAFTAVEAQQ
ncbi:phosphate acetyltransferase [Bifidobacterium commune]|uniref:Phosphate acetyltransferase n=1 Tax=Bifidobacterium commune TaxID=1505727 RepID=A0A1C4H2N3_9BIFI|nr:phosphate acetyltransferase [Bifidobacterium commune]MBB2954932.1 phosphate acetyltransferase [Bifidobacterium commune]SCC79075.1 phosphate acetyltransferase [Bifidobacterium commune]